jgi:hypothetical protein
LRLNFKAWYRNSLLQDYFSFGKSDIDLSIELSGNEDLLLSAQKIQKIFSLNPLIKEINFYYPFILKELPFIANPFETSKDPSLLKFLPKLDYSTSQNESQKFVYLLRMYFSNLKQLNKCFTRRDLEKWSFHFKLVGLSDCLAKLALIKNEKDLLEIIFENFAGLNKKHFESIVHISDCQLAQVPLHLQFQQAPNPEELFNLMPQLFCFTGTDLKNCSIFCEQIFIFQMSWETLGVLVQPLLFEDGNHTHLFNLISTLNNASVSDFECELKKKKLIVILNQYVELLSSLQKN